MGECGEGGKVEEREDVLELGRKRKDVRWMEHMFFDGVQSVDDISATLKIQDKVQHELY